MLSIDGLTFLFWITTYVLIILYNVKYHRLGIPPIAIGLNFGWETAMFVGLLFTQAQFHWGYFLWVLMDLAIVITYFWFCKPVYTKRKYNFGFVYLASLVLFSLLAHFDLENMPLFAFCIELIINLEWLLYLAKRSFVLSPLAVGFCLTKLLGDLAAWYVFRQSGVITLLSIAILLLNILCLYTALFRDQIQRSDRKH